MKIFKVVGFPPPYLIGEFSSGTHEFFQDLKVPPLRANFKEYFSHIQDDTGN